MPIFWRKKIEVLLLFILIKTINTLMIMGKFLNNDMLSSTERGDVGTNEG